MSKNSVDALVSGAAALFSHALDAHDAGPFSPDILTPAQYFSTRAAASPCERLLAAMLEDAVSCFQRNRNATNSSRRNEFREARDWLFDRAGTAFTSCPVVCENLGINAAELRRYLREWQPEASPRLELRPPARRRDAFTTRSATPVRARITRRQPGF